ncbi:MAG: GNAT family N-acetyltransferase [Candidatus Schekmanbacteria bacterium]|nr:GNAT family N-acetyltransferase [Candidatus Schekmanbacteria bacterium]
MSTDAPTLQTPRTSLRAYRESDRQPFVELNTDAEVRRHMDGPLTQLEADALFDRFVSGAAPDAWAVVDKDTGTYLGHAFLGSEPDVSGIAIGFLILRRHWGRGLATEVASALVSFAFAQRDAGAVGATVDAYNPASIRVLEKIGLGRAAEREDENGRYYIYGLERQR